MLYFRELPVPVAAVSVFYTPDDGRIRPKHVEKVCSNKICILLHHVGVLFNIYYDARKHKIKIWRSYIVK